MYKIICTSVSENFTNKTTTKIVESREQVQKELTKKYTKRQNFMYTNIEVYSYYRDITKEPSLSYKNTYFGDKID